MLLRTGLLLTLCFGCLNLLSQNSNDSLEFITYYYDGGGKSSEGYLRDGKPDGYWKSFYPNGNLKAEGNRINFLLSGPWLFYNEDGEKTIEINYSEDKKEGLKKTFANNQVMKEEAYVNDRLQGYTRVYYEGGKLKKEIPFVEGREKGVGYEYAQDERIIKLQTYKDGVLTRQQSINKLDKQGVKQGMWMDFYATRNKRWEGPYVNDLKNGYWKYYQANGNLMRVEKWIMGELQQGVKEVAKLEIRKELNPSTGKLSFKGAFRDGIPEGVHRDYDDDGNVVDSRVYDNGVVLYEGIIDEEGNKQGPWKEYYATGELKAEGHYKDNLKVKTWIYYYRSGKVEQTGRYRSGLTEGKWTWNYENGMTWREEEYVGGLEDGLSIEYSDTGHVIATGEYIEGFREGSWTFEVNDHREEGSFFEGQRTGKWKHYYLGAENILRFEGEYESGLEMGLHTYYYENGEIQKRGPYSGGEREGLWEFFTEDGLRIITIEYKAGKEMKYNGEKIR